MLLGLLLSTNLSGQKVLSSLRSDTWTGSAWQNATLQSNTHDGSGFLINSLTQIWNVPGLVWDDVSRSSYTNNGDGTAQQVVSQSWDGATWNDLSRITYTYNASKKVLTTQTEMSLGAIWMNSSLTTNTYDGSGFLTNELSQTWDLISSSWKDNTRSIYTNNADGNPSQVVDQHWDGVSTWTNTTRTTYTYNGSHKVTTATLDNYTSGNWVPFSQDTYSYDGSGFLITTVSQLWDSGLASYKNSTQSSYTNNSDGTPSVVVTQLWNGSSYDNQSRFTYTYSEVTGTSEIIKEDDFIIYPNPAHDVVTIKTSRIFGRSTYSFADQSGKTVLKGILTDETTSINIAPLTEGIYLLYIGEENRNIYKVIKK
jgi:hypothetical protein